MKCAGMFFLAKFECLVFFLPCCTVVQIQSLCCDRERMSEWNRYHDIGHVREVSVPCLPGRVCSVHCVGGIRSSIMSMESTEQLINFVVFHQEKCCLWKKEEIQRIRYTSLS